MNDDGLDDEVTFWRHMIEWWKDNNDEPVPTRMHEVLKLAKSKFRLVEVPHASECSQLH